MEDSVRGLFFVGVSSICFGTTPILAKLAYQEGVTVDAFLFFRFLLAFAMMAAILTAFRRRALPGRRDLAILLMLGAFCYFLQSSFYFTSLLYSPVPLVVLVLYTYPAFVTIGAHLLGWEGISRRVGGSVLLAVGGLALVANPFGVSLGFGAVLALMASITYTVYILASTGVLRRVTGALASFYVMGGASVSFGLAALWTGSLSVGFDPQAWVWILLIAVVTVVGITAFYLGISMIGPSKSSVIRLLEPVTSVGLAFAIFSEAMTGFQAVGGVLILVSAVIVATARRSRPRKGPPPS